MPKIAYINKDFKPASLKLIVAANKIITDYTAQGYVLTLRQLFYQMVSRDILPNTTQSYDKLGAVISDARLAGFVDWEAIEDRTRDSVARSQWASPEDIIASAASSYHIDYWAGQKNHVEVWVEKQALASVFEGCCGPLDIRTLACRGYVSQSELWRAARRLKSFEARGISTVILHFGDHDPSGIDMTRDLRERLYMFGARPEVKRVALNMDQIEEYQPPPNPAKTTDSRFAEYQTTYGDESWELDALEPAVLEQLVRDNVVEYVDATAFEARKGRETLERVLLERIADRMDWIRDELGEDELLGEDEDPDEKE